MTTFSTLDKTASPVDLDAEQVVAATEFYAENQTDIERGRNSDNFVEYYKTSLTHVRGTQMFGVFSETAYQLFFGEFIGIARKTPSFRAGMDSARQSCASGLNKQHRWIPYQHATTSSL